MNELSKSDLEFIVDYINELKITEPKHKDFCDLVAQLVYEFTNENN